MIRFNRPLAIVIVILFCFLSSAVLPPVNGSVTERNITNTTASIGPSSTSDKVRIVASFYPIFEFVKKVGGDRVEATSLIPVGVEPHDFDPTVQQVQSAQTADMVVLNGAGF
jgi:zinc transport system substrate-binding protein